MACAKDGHADVAELLLDGVSTDFVGDATADGYTALLAACHSQLSDGRCDELRSAATRRLSCLAGFTRSSWR